MAGASPTHVRLAANLIIRLGIQLDGKSCEVFPQDLRVLISETDDYVYPDIVVVCDAEFAHDNLLNPVVIIEVLSPSTEMKDRTIKFEALRKRASLMDYILVAQNRVHVEHFHRQPDASWNLRILETMEDEVTLESIGCRLLLGQIYARVSLPALREIAESGSQVSA
jgi:Uma2 family endonuclease